MNSYQSPHAEAYLVQLIYQYGGFAVADTCAEIARICANSSHAENCHNEELEEMKNKSDLYAQFWWDLRKASQTEDLEPIATNEDTDIDEQYHREFNKLCYEIGVIKNRLNRLSELTGYPSFLQDIINAMGGPTATGSPPILDIPDNLGHEPEIQFFQNKLPELLGRNIDYFFKQPSKPGHRLDFLEERDKLIQAKESKSSFNITRSKLIGILEEKKLKEEQKRAKKVLIQRALDKIPHENWLPDSYCKELERELACRLHRTLEKTA
ncbi:hypothetical protein [Methylomicrobium lacus]|uniref:hypothetical protein n=1 Tax=Methylomicrobium lacus TaxID=136992 RepID=UPI0035A828B9